MCPSGGRSPEGVALTLTVEEPRKMDTTMSSNGWVDRRDCRVREKRPAVSYASNATFTPRVLHFDARLQADRQLRCRRSLILEQLELAIWRNKTEHMVSLPLSIPDTWVESALLHDLSVGKAEQQVWYTRELGIGTDPSPH